YVKIDGPLDYAEWIAGLKAGRSFVSNGPMLEFALGNHGLGDTIKAPGATTLALKAAAKSILPLAKLEVIYNGEVVAWGSMEDKSGLKYDRQRLPAARFTADDFSPTIAGEIRLDKSGWLAVRATGPGHPDSPRPSLYAHTNPIYVEIADSPLRS